MLRAATASLPSRLVLRVGRPQATLLAARALSSQCAESAASVRASAASTAPAVSRCTSESGSGSGSGSGAGSSAWQPWRTAAAAATLAAATAWTGVASCEDGLTPLEEAVAHGETTVEATHEAVSTALVSDAIEAEEVEESRHPYKKKMKTPLMLVTGTSHPKLAKAVGALRCGCSLFVCLFCGCMLLDWALSFATHLFRCALQLPSCMKCWWMRTCLALRTERCLFV